MGKVRLHRMDNLTVHCMVRNEPFVYYAVKSVYDLAGKILLYDTGSYDKHTLEDIQTLIAEDVDEKIVFKEIPIEVDETKWNKNNFRQLCQATKGKRGKWVVREIMIKDTDTEYFLILDGDEVHYRGGCRAIADTMNHWPIHKSCGFAPLIWFCDMEHTFHVSRSGRIFKTADIGMSNSSPNEIHTIKKTGHRIGPGSECSFSVPNMRAFAHFETFLKPWRRSVPPQKKQVFTGEFPEVIVDNMAYVERFQNESTA
jgi:hypothetical protein